MLYILKWVFFSDERSRVSNKLESNVSKYFIGVSVTEEDLHGQNV